MTLGLQIAQRLKRDLSRLVAIVTQQHDTREVLVLGWMDEETLDRALNSGKIAFWSCSHREYQHEGDTSGHVQYMKPVSLDCDGDALLIKVDQVGAACHTGKRTCLLEGGDLGAVVGSAKDG